MRGQECGPGRRASSKEYAWSRLAAVMGWKQRRFMAAMNEIYFGYSQARRTIDATLAFVRPDNEGEIR